MAEAKVETKAKDTEKKAAEVKQPRHTAVEYLKTEALKGGKDKGEVVDRALAAATKQGVKANSKGKQLTKENMGSLLNAMCRDIKNERGKAKGGWWSTVSIQDDDKAFRFVPRK